MIIHLLCYFSCLIWAWVLQFLWSETCKIIACGFELRVHCCLNVACLLSWCGIPYLLWNFCVQRTVLYCSHIEGNFVLNIACRYWCIYFLMRWNIRCVWFFLCHHYRMTVLKYCLTSTPWTLHHCEWNIWWINGLNPCRAIF